MRKRQNLTIALLGMALSMTAQSTLLRPGQKEATETFAQGQLKVTSVAPNAVRIQYKKADVQLYVVPHDVEPVSKLGEIGLNLFPDSTERIVLPHVV